MKNILFIHQSADLYGSDKMLLYLVESVKNEAYPIIVVPEIGPLTEELRKRDIEFIINPVIKVSRELYASFKIFIIPFLIFSAMRSLRGKLGNRKIDIIHSNTLAVFLGAFYSKKFKIKHVWHIHEIIIQPKLAAKMYPFLVNLFSDYVVFNSKASCEYLCVGKPELKKKAKVIYNGLDRDLPFSSKDEQKSLRKKFFNSENESSLILGLFGRINKYKGHNLLLNVFEQLFTDNKNIKLLYIGSTTKSQANLLDELRKEITKRKLDDYITIIPFQKELWKFYDSVDIIIVPTISLESFGLVAIEGMLSKKPVIGSNHGGLKEIILHNKTGILFEPNNEVALKSSIKKLIDNKNLITLFGEEGEKRAILEFSLENYVNKFKVLYRSI